VEVKVEVVEVVVVVVVVESGERHETQARMNDLAKNAPRGDGRVATHSSKKCAQSMRGSSDSPIALRRLSS
jgi:hypothetical protein